MKLGSTAANGNVWLRGRWESLPIEGMLDWLVGVKGLSDTMVDGLVTPLEKLDEFSRVLEPFRKSLSSAGGSPDAVSFWRPS